MVLIPLTPAFVLGIPQYKAHTECATRLDNLKKHGGRLWDKACSDANSEELTRDSRDLQNEIYNHRRTCPLIFDWLYTYLRKEHEDQMNKAADEMVKDALESLSE